MTSPSDSRALGAEAVSYRLPMEVRRARYYPTPNGPAVYPVCPRCSTTMDREYQSYCDRCGQALRWDTYLRR